MEIKFLNEEEKNELLEQVVVGDSGLKDLIVSYIGRKMNQEEVTVEMIVEIMKDEFPEFLLVIAEENYMRGYEDCLNTLNSEDMI